MSSHWTTPHTRQDCKRDNVRVILPRATRLGFAKQHAKRGFWIYADSGFGQTFGRVLGRVKCEGRIYVEAILLVGGTATPCIRWIAPEDVAESYEHPPRAVLQFIMGDWHDMPSIVDRAHSGALSFACSDKDS